MKRLPALLSLLLFVALCASMAYWWLQWLAPAPRPVAAPPIAQRTMPPLTSAFKLFGGHSPGGATAIQLRGIIHSAHAADSVAIVAVEGKPPRALRTHAEVMPGVELKEIRSRTVILSGRSGDQEVMLPEFSTLAVAAPVGADADAVAPAAAPPQVPAQPAGSPAAQPVQGTPEGIQGPVTAGPGTAGRSAEGADNPVPVPPAKRAPR